MTHQDVAHIISRKSPLAQIMAEVNAQLRDKPQQVKLALTALLVGGHILLEDTPGMGKTLLARAFAHHLGLEWVRLQCTNDTIPADIVGINIFEPHKACFVLRKGVVFTQLLLADELNRAPSKSQSALLEAMAEQQVTIDGVIYPLPRPFVVIATQNPQEQIGVSPLPESQLDRFAIRLTLGLPSRNAEADILRDMVTDELLSPPMLEPTQFLALMARARNVHIANSIITYLQDIAAACRTHILPDLSIRALLHAKSLAQAHALIEGRDYVVPEDIQAILLAAWGHRNGRYAQNLEQGQIYAELSKIITHIDTP